MRFLPFAACLIASSAFAADAVIDYGIHTRCKPIRLEVAASGEGPQKMGLDEHRISTAMEARLRSARLYDPDASEYLFASTSVVSPAFSVRLAMYRWAPDIGNGLGGIAGVWERTVTGTHGADGQAASYILAALSELTDEFLADYLRVNEASCGDEPDWGYVAELAKRGRMTLDQRAAWDEANRRGLVPPEYAGSAQSD